MSEQYKTNEEEGRRAWSSLSSQMMELKGFAMAFFQSVLRYLRRNLVLLFLIPMGFGVGAYLWKSQAEQSFQSSMTVSYVHLEKKIYADMIDKLNRSLGQGSAAVMPGIEQLSEEALSTLKHVQAINLKGENLRTDLSVERVPFDLVVSVNSLEYLSSIEQALVDYLDSPPFIQQRMAYNVENGKKSKAFFAGQVESFQERIEEMEGDMNPETFEILVDQLNEAQLSLGEAEAQLAFNANIEVLHGLFAGSAVSLKNESASAWKGAAMGLILALLIGLFRKGKS